MNPDIQLYQDVASLKTSVIKIETNDLPHLYEGQKAIDTKLWGVLILIVGVILTAAIKIALDKVKKCK